jgi:hypothetical protein
MKRSLNLAFGIGGIIVLMLLIPLFEPPQPRGLSITRDTARATADSMARKLGIEVDAAWVLVTWESSQLLESELARQPERRRTADRDPVLEPRLAGFRVTYFRRGLEKFPAYGWVAVSRDGRVIGARRTPRPEEEGGHPETESLRRAAETIAALQLPGAPEAAFESARPAVQRLRTDHVFRYRVPSDEPLGNVAHYLSVYFAGDQFSGWALIDEYADGSQFRFAVGENIAGTFLGFTLIYVLLLILMIIFLRKYHAGEVGVGNAATLLIASAGLMLVIAWFVSAENSYGTNFGGTDAPLTAVVMAAFKFFFYDMPVAILIFLSWSVGESYTRERWGHRLAAFDAIFRRDPLNATVGQSLLDGIVAAPAVAAASLVTGAIGIYSGLAHASLGAQSEFMLLGSRGGPLTVIAFSLFGALLVAVPSFLFIIGSRHRKKALPVGIVLAIIVGTIFGTVAPPIAPLTMQMLFGFGGVIVAIAIFMAFDLLSATVSIFGGALLIAFVPHLRNVTGEAFDQALPGLVVPFVLLGVLAMAGIITRRRIEYTYEDLAPHVRRIIERERVKAEIDAANRIQSALLPPFDPQLDKVSIASHYRAASEIGGDYYDFLPLPDGKLGIAFGDVAGHGLTSGIIMAMAKSALLVQIDNDETPSKVMEVLNRTVIRTAPKRMLMTFFFGLLDPVKRSLVFSSAGHLDPYVYRAASGRIEALSSWGYPLGVRRREPFQEHSVKFETGDRLILYSDGLIEAIDDAGEPFGFDRFEQTIRRNGKKSAEELRQSLLAAVRKFTANRPPEDDQTLVVICFSEGAREAATALEMQEAGAVS